MVKFRKKKKKFLRKNEFKFNLKRTHFKAKFFFFIINFRDLKSNEEEKEPFP